MARVTRQIMTTKKRAKPPARKSIPVTPHMAEILAEFEERKTALKALPPDHLVNPIDTAASLLKELDTIEPHLDEFAADYKAYTGLDFKGVMRRFDGLRVVTNLKDAGEWSEVMGWYPGESSPPVGRDLDLETFYHYLTWIFAPDRSYWSGDMHHDGLDRADWIDQAFVRDWRIRLGVEPTTPMRDKLLDEEVFNGYPWVPEPFAAETHRTIASIQCEAVEPGAEPVAARREVERRVEEGWTGADPDDLLGRHDAGQVGDQAFAAEVFKRFFGLWQDSYWDNRVDPPVEHEGRWDFGIYETTRAWLPAAGEPGGAGKVPNFVIESGGHDRGSVWMEHDVYFASRDGVLDVSATAMFGDDIAKNARPVSPWCFAGLDTIKGVRELRMNGHGIYFYPIGHAGTMPGPNGKPVPRALRPLVPPGAPLRASLRVLDLSGNYFDSLGVFLEGLESLDVLHLDDTNIVDAGALVATLAKHCPNIETVTLSGTLLDDEGMAVVDAWLAPGVGWRGTGE